MSKKLSALQEERLWMEAEAHVARLDYGGLCAIASRGMHWWEADNESQLYDMQRRSAVDIVFERLKKSRQQTMNRRKAIKLLGLGAAAVATGGIKALTGKPEQHLLDWWTDMKRLDPINVVYGWNNWTKKFEVVEVVPPDTDLIDWIEKHEKTITDIGKGPKYVV